jgi:hypothetical protein
LIQDELPDASDFMCLAEVNKDSPHLKIARVVSEEDRAAVYNFAVMDDRAIRFERDRETFTAFAIMHAPELARELSGRFDQMYAEAAPLPDVAGCVTR